MENKVKEILEKINSDPNLNVLISCNGTISDYNYEPYNKMSFTRVLKLHKEQNNLCFIYNLENNDELFNRCNVIATNLYRFLTNGNIYLYGDCYVTSDYIGSIDYEETVPYSEIKALNKFREKVTVRNIHEIEKLVTPEYDKRIELTKKADAELSKVIDGIKAVQYEE